jgi:hypothetical protein
MAELSPRQQEVADSLVPLFEQAEREGLWFYDHCGGLRFSPAALRREQAEGRYWWHADIWQLCDPSERLRQIEAQIAELGAEAARIREEMRNG